ncbi:hypothetical protein [Pararhodonellum marinum]|uniref:hypothetical protein n=1 Tax=Pararhodonellum marinum TaxID=2755358 RepID=UPI00188EE20E|nr:hypothetical protein [Pararhodonellum marinum]
MENLENLKNLWKSQKDLANIDPREIQQRVKTEHLKMLLVNVLLTLAMGSSLVMIIMIMIQFTDRSWLFYSSLGLMGLLLLLFMIGMWGGVSLSKSSALENPSLYLTKQLKKIKIRRYMLAYGTPAFLFLMYLSFMLFLADVLKGAHPLFHTMTYIFVIGFFVFMGIFARYRSQKSLASNQEIQNKLIGWLKDLQNP